MGKSIYLMSLQISERIDASPKSCGDRLSFSGDYAGCNCTSKSAHHQTFSVPKLREVVSWEYVARSHRGDEHCFRSVWPPYCSDVQKDSLYSPPRCWKCTQDPHLSTGTRHLIYNAVALDQTFKNALWLTRGQVTWLLTGTNWMDEEAIKLCAWLVRLPQVV